MKVGDTFQTYYSFSEAFELHKQSQNALYRVYASETVPNYLKKARETRHRNPRGDKVGAFLHIRHER